MGREINRSPRDSERFWLDSREMVEILEDDDDVKMVEILEDVGCLGRNFWVDCGFGAEIYPNAW